MLPDSSLSTLRYPCTTTIDPRHFKLQTTRRRTSTWLNIRFSKLLQRPRRCYQYPVEFYRQGGSKGGSSGLYDLQLSFYCTSALSGMYLCCLVLFTFRFFSLGREIFQTRTKHETLAVLHEIIAESRAFHRPASRELRPGPPGEFTFPTVILHRFCVLLVSAGVGLGVCRCVYGGAWFGFESADGKGAR